MPSWSQEAVFQVARNRVTSVRCVMSAGWAGHRGLYVLRWTELVLVPFCLSSLCHFQKVWRHAPPGPAICMTHQDMLFLARRGCRASFSGFSDTARPLQRAIKLGSDIAASRHSSRRRLRDTVGDEAALINRQLVHASQVLVPLSRPAQSSTWRPQTGRRLSLSNAHYSRWRCTPYASLARCSPLS